jgi:hypothetical protein
MTATAITAITAANETASPGLMLSSSETTQFFSNHRFYLLLFNRQENGFVPFDFYKAANLLITAANNFLLASSFSFSALIFAFGALATKPGLASIFSLRATSNSKEALSFSSLALRDALIDILFDRHLITRIEERGAAQGFFLHFIRGGESEARKVFAAALERFFRGDGELRTLAFGAIEERSCSSGCP